MQRVENYIPSDTNTNSMNDVTDIFGYLLSLMMNFSRNINEDFGIHHLLTISM